MYASNMGSDAGATRSIWNQRSITVNWLNPPCSATPAALIRTEGTASGAPGTEKFQKW